MRHPHTNLTRLLAMTVLLGAAAAPAVAQNNDEEVVVVRAGKIITVTGDIIERGEIVIIDGEIRLIGKGLEFPASAEIIDASDETVMPGMINPRTRPPGLPGRSRSGVHGDYRALDDYYPEDLDLEDLLKAGFTTAAIYPPGSGIPGRAAVYRTGGPVDDRVIGEESTLRITFTSLGRDKAALRAAFKAALAEIDKAKKAKADWEMKQKEDAAKKAAEEKKQEEEAKKNGNGNGNGNVNGKPEGGEKPAEEKPAEFKPPPMNPAYVPIVALIQETADFTPIIELGSAATVLHCIDVLEELDDPAHYFYLPAGGFRADVENAVEALGEAERLVLTTAALSRLSSTVIRYNFPAELADAGCELALLPSSDSASGYERFRAAIADLVRAGLRPEAALRAVTINPAKVLGLDAKLGSLEKGKQADLVFFDGDWLDPLSQVTRVMSNGKIIWENEE